MSEAALAYVEIPKQLPTGTTWKQWRLAALAPKCATAVEALEKAGYSLITAQKAGKRALTSVGVQRASEAIAAAKLDSARQIKSESATRVLAQVKKTDVDPTFALSAWATASKIESEYPDADTGVGDAELQAARCYVERVIQLATEALIRNNGVSITVPLSSQDIADIVLKAQTA